MTFHRQRQSVLAGNVANVDTPGYRPMDIERIGVGGHQAAAASTRAGHATSAGPSASISAFEDAGELQSANGNAVNLERELAKIDANRVRYGAASSLVSRRIAILKYAAADGVG